jgi:HK97 family phage major capsid protein
MKYAVEDDVVKGFEAANTKMGGLECEVEELKSAADTMQKQIRRVYSGIAKSFSGEFSGKTFWPDQDQARDFGMLVLAAAGKRVSNKGLVEKALSEGVNTGGGYAVPSEMLPRLIDMLGKYGKFRSNVSVIPLGSDRTQIPALTSDGVVYVPGEGAEITESDIAFGQISLLPKTWATLIAISQELTEDSILAVGEIVARSFTRNMAKYEDLVGFLGDGTSTYFGMTGIIGKFKKMLDDSVVPAGLVIGSGNAYSELTWSDFEAMFALLPEEYEEGAKVYCSKKFYYNVIRRAALAAGDKATGMFDLLGPNKTRYVAGYPVEFVKSLPTAEANTQVCCLLGSLSEGCYLGERRQLSIDASEHILFKKNQVCIRGVERIDINAFGCGSATEVGPIVGLRTASS